MFKGRLEKAFRLGSLLAVSAGAVVLSGCSISSFESLEPQGTQVTAVSHIQGKVHGGVLPVQGSWIELWQTGPGTWNNLTQSYAPSTLNSTSNPNFIAYTKSAVANDGSGLPPGYFDFGNATLNCTTGSYLYLTTTGGHTLSGAAAENDNVIQVAVIGKCGTDLSQVNVYLSETSSVAAAYALGNFMSIDRDPTSGLQRLNITAPANNTASGGCTLTVNTLTNCTGAGLAHGFDNAANLVDSTRTDGTQPTGAPNLRFARNTNAIAPQAMVNTIGNILQSCVDSGPSTSGSLSLSCSKLFQNSATGYNSDSGTLNAAPSNTLQATINMARNPSTKVSALYGMQTTNSPFTPMMSTMPGSFMLSILYPAAAVGDSTFASPTDVALDAKDNVYVAYNGTGTGVLSGLTANGSLTFGGAAPSVTLANPATLSVDPKGNVWLADDTANNSGLQNVGNVYGFGANGTYLNYYRVPYGHAAGIAFDNDGNFFVGRDATDFHSSALQYNVGSYTYSQAGFTSGVSLLRAAIDSYGSFRGLGPTTFLSWTPGSTGCFPRYSESSVTLDNGNAMALAVDNRPGNYITFAVSTTKLTTGLTYLSGSCSSSAGKNVAGTKALVSTNSNAAALDGYGNLFWNTPAGNFYMYLNAESYEGGSTTAMGGTVTSVIPCLLASGAQTCASPTKTAGLAIDSSGAMWFGAANGTTAYLVQSFGMAAPTFPLLAYEKSGVPF